jgi:hypothetical protein
VQVFYASPCKEEEKMHTEAPMSMMYSASVSRGRNANTVRSCQSYAVKKNAKDKIRAVKRCRSRSAKEEKHRYLYFLVVLVICHGIIMHASLSHTDLSCKIACSGSTGLHVLNDQKHTRAFHPAHPKNSRPTYFFKEIFFFVFDS